MLKSCTLNSGLEECPANPLFTGYSFCTVRWLLLPWLFCKAKPTQCKHKEPKKAHSVLVLSFAGQPWHQYQSTFSSLPIPRIPTLSLHLSLYMLRPHSGQSSYQKYVYKLEITSSVTHSPITQHAKVRKTDSWNHFNEKGTLKYSFLWIPNLSPTPGLESHSHMIL